MMDRQLIFQVRFICVWNNLIYSVRDSGWALKKASSVVMDPEQRELARQFFEKNRECNNRACPNKMHDALEGMKTAGGAYKFSFESILSVKQLSGLFGRMEAARKSEQILVFLKDQVIDENSCIIKSH